MKTLIVCCDSLVPFELKRCSSHLSSGQITIELPILFSTIIPHAKEVKLGLYVAILNFFLLVIMIWNMCQLYKLMKLQCQRYIHPEKERAKAFCLLTIWVYRWFGFNSSFINNHSGANIIKPIAKVIVQLKVPKTHRMNRINSLDFVLHINCS